MRSPAFGYRRRRRFPLRRPSLSPSVSKRRERLETLGRCQSAAREETFAFSGALIHWLLFAAHHIKIIKLAGTCFSTYGKDSSSPVSSSSRAGLITCNAITQVTALMMVIYCVSLGAGN